MASTNRCGYFREVPGRLSTRSVPGKIGDARVTWRKTIGRATSTTTRAGVSATMATSSWRSAIPMMSSMKSGKKLASLFSNRFFLRANGDETRIQRRTDSTGKRIHRHRSERRHGEDNDDSGDRFAIAGRAGDPDRANSGYHLYGACDRGIARSHSRHNRGRAYPGASAIRAGDHQKSYRPKTIRAQVETGAGKF